MITKRLLVQLSLAVSIAAINSSLQAQDWNFSFGADVVQVVSNGAKIAPFTGQGAAQNPGAASASIDKKTSGTFYRVRVDCSVDEWGNSPRVQLISDWADGGNPRRRAAITCPPDMPFADLWATQVQAASQGDQFLCQFNDADFGDAFVSCGSAGEW
jgi:hypothetical protein